ncbi:MAG TPA: flagellar basal body P-ring protein FlgI, partial [Tepiditoga sp.]|nr:flagellar basal body P-ring protein FlgI [Tepiditoga sp.]
KNLGVEISSSLTTKNSALVMIFADIPAFYKEGMKLDVTVTAFGDAKSLEGGYLVQTPLKGADNKVYAVAQGSVLTGGANVKASDNLQTKTKISGYIPTGAIVENEIPSQFTDDNFVTLNLKTPDVTTAARVSLAINTVFSDKIAKASDPSSIQVKIPDLFYDDVISFLALIEEIDVQPDVKAKIIINEKTGTIVLGGNIKMSDFTLSYGNYVISVEKGKIGEENATISNIITALKTAGAVPQDIISIIQNISAAGYIFGDVVVM